MLPTSHTKILAALNRAQMKLVRLATRKFASMFRDDQTLTVNSGNHEVTIPEGAFGLVVNAVPRHHLGPGLQSRPCS
jgi:hypothetical protein